MVILKPILVLIGAYLIGSLFPTWLLIKVFTGKDITKIGTTSPGAENVYRHFGIPLAVASFILEVGKGFLTVYAASRLIEADYIQYFLPAVLLATILGHCFSIFNGFKGGRGMSCLMGGYIFFIPYEFIVIFFAASLFAIYVLKKFRIGPIVFIPVSPIAAFFFDYPAFIEHSVKINVSLLIVASFVGFLQFYISSLRKKKGVEVYF